LLFGTQNVNGGRAPDEGGYWYAMTSGIGLPEPLPAALR